jgi:hypothetical protein
VAVATVGIAASARIESRATDSRGIFAPSYRGPAQV